MAFQGNDAGQDKKTGYTLEGKEIILTKTRGRPIQGVRTRDISLDTEKKRLEVVSVYAVTGSIAETARLTGVSKHTLNDWKKTQWWAELLDAVRNENDHQFDAAFTKILEKVIGGIDDRLINGDEVILKDGSKTKRQVSLRDLVGALAYTIDKRQLIRGRPTSRTETVSVENRLEKLVDHFTSLSKKGVKPALPAAQDAPQAPLPVVVEDVPQPAQK